MLRALLNFVHHASACTVVIKWRYAPCLEGNNLAGSHVSPVMALDRHGMHVHVWLQAFTGLTPYVNMAHPQIMVAVVTHNLRPRFPASCPEWYKVRCSFCTEIKVGPYWDAKQTVYCMHWLLASLFKQVRCVQRTWLIHACMVAGTGLSMLAQGPEAQAVLCGCHRGALRTRRWKRAWVGAVGARGLVGS